MKSKLVSLFPLMVLAAACSHDIVSNTSEADTAQAQTASQSQAEPDASSSAIAQAALAAALLGGTGPFKADMIQDDSLPTHTIYTPRDLSPWSQAAPLPVVVWGNGACANYGNRFRYFLTEIASHGYFAIAIGPIGPSYLEEGPSLLAPGAQDTRPPPSERKPSSFASQLIDAMDWADVQNKTPTSPYFGKLDTSRVAVMGQSCGGLQAITASSDPRTATTVVWNSGTFPIGTPALPGSDATKASLSTLHAPVAYISGDESDVAFVNAEADYEAINQVPIFRAYEKGVGHTGTYRTPDGGSFGQVAVAWLDWQMKGDVAAAKWFKGDDCKLCSDPDWVVKKKHLD